MDIYFENKIYLVTADISGKIFIWNVNLQSLTGISLEYYKEYNFGEDINVLISINLSSFLIFGANNILLRFDFTKEISNGLKRL